MTDPRRLSERELEDIIEYEADFTGATYKPTTTFLMAHEIVALRAENARLREFVRFVLYDYLEVDKQTQCPLCLWVPGRSHNPIHECDAVDMIKLVGLRAALQEGSDD